MPHQNTHPVSIEAPTGTTALPRASSPSTKCSFFPLTHFSAVARVKKIIAQDDDIAQCSTTAAFSIAIATVGRRKTNP